MKRERRALLRDQTRHFAAGILESAEPMQSGRFEALNLTDEEMIFVEEELQAIALRIIPASKPKGGDHGQGA